MNRISMHILENQKIDFSFDKLATGTYTVEIVITEGHKELSRIVFFMDEKTYLEMGSKMNDYGHFMVMQEEK